MLRSKNKKTDHSIDDEKEKMRVLEEYLESVKNFNHSGSEKSEETESEEESVKSESEDGNVKSESGSSEGEEDKEKILREYLELVKREISFKRKLSVLHEPPTIDNVIHKIKSGKIHNIIVMIGAGVSVNAGIPDFRSPKTGLYANLQGFLFFLDSKV
jgi:hypothetical protein